MSETGNGAPLVAIGEAARIVGVSPQTLRLWGSEGLVHPVRSKGDTGASVASLSPMAKAYGTSMRELLGAGLREGSRLCEIENFAGHKRQADLRVRRHSEIEGVP